MAIKKFVIIAIILLLAVAGIMFLQLNQTAKEQVITSDDGILKLTIPQKALPKGTDIKSIKVSKVNLKEEADKNAYVYALEPNGLTLSEPAKVEMTLKDTKDEIPILLHFSGEKVLPLEDVSIEQNSQEHKTQITAKLSQFSYLMAIMHMFILKTDEPKIVYTEEPFTITTQIHNIGKSSTRIYEPRTAYYDEVTTSLVLPWTVGRGKILMVEGFDNVIEPDIVNDLPEPITILKENQNITRSAKFTCIAPQDNIDFQYGVLILGQLKVKTRRGTSTSERISEFEESVVRFGSFTCSDPGIKLEDRNRTMQDLAPQGMIPLEILVINGKFFPAMQFNQAGADVGCPASHYHSQFEVSNIDLDAHLSDPNPKGCGFGTVDSIPRKTEMVPKEKAERF